jgi:hypothetical protein
MSAASEAAIWKKRFILVPFASIPYLWNLYLSYGLVDASALRNVKFFLPGLRRHPNPAIDLRRPSRPIVHFTGRLTCLMELNLSGHARMAAIPRQTVARPGANGGLASGKLRLAQGRRAACDHAKANSAQPAFYPRYPHM